MCIRLEQIQVCGKHLCHVFVFFYIFLCGNSGTSLVKAKTSKKLSSWKPSCVWVLPILPCRQNNILYDICYIIFLNCLCLLQEKDVNLNIPECITCRSESQTTKSRYLWARLRQSHVWQRVVSVKSGSLTQFLGVFLWKSVYPAEISVFFFHHNVERFIELIASVLVRNILKLFCYSRQVAASLGVCFQLKSSWTFDMNCILSGSEASTMGAEPVLCLCCRMGQTIRGRRMYDWPFKTSNTPYCG